MGFHLSGRVKRLLPSLFSLLLGISLVLSGTFAGKGLRSFLRSPLKFAGVTQQLHRRLAGGDEGHDEDGGHGDDDGHGGTSSLFGALEDIDGEILMIALLIVVGAVLTLESIFHALHHYTSDTAFNNVVVAIEKELMVVGCTAFALKIIINTQTQLSHDVFFALEFADLLVPFFTFVNCFLSLILIFMSLNQCDIWRKAYHLKLEELLDEFLREDGNYSYFKLCAPFSRIVSEMEFRVFHDIFCEAYRIQRKAFAFDEYVSLVFEKFSLEIIETGFLNWAIFLILMLLSLTRISKDRSFRDCDHEEASCSDERAIIIFTILGTGMFVVFLVIAVISRYYETCIISSRGLQSVEEYPRFLQQMEEVAHTNVETKRLGEEELKKAVKDAMMSSGFGSSRKHHTTWLTTKIMWVFESASSKIVPTGGNSIHEEDFDDDMMKAAIARSIKRGSVFTKTPDARSSAAPSLETIHSVVMTSDTSFLFGESMIIDSPAPGDENEHNTGLPRLQVSAPIVEEREDEVATPSGMEGVPSLRGGEQSSEEGRDSPALTECGFPSQTQAQPQAQTPTAAPGEGVASESQREGQVEAPIESLNNTDIEAQTRTAFNHYIHDTAVDRNVHEPKPKLVSRLSTLGTYIDNVFHRKHTGELQEVFLFSQPWLYFSSVKLLPLPLSLYIALWCIHFSAAHTSGLSKFLAIAPAILSIACLMYTVKCAAMLQAVYHVDKDAVLEVLEQTEGSRILGETIRDKLLSKLDLMGDPYTELRELFRSIDHDGSNRLSRNEFEFLMNRLDINFSKRKWKQIYHEIDRNYDDEVTFEEFFFFLFPTHDVSLALERKRLKIIRKRVAAKRRKSEASAKQRRSTYHRIEVSRTEEVASGEPRENV